MRAVLTHKFLKNGVEVVLKENRFAQATAVQCWVGVGSLDELPEERGMAHFLEHMLFKGTSRRKVGEIAAQVEAAGGEINAYTTFDHTVYHLTLGSSQATLGVDLLADAIGDSTLDPGETDREREVILEEIRRGNDSPGAKVGRKIFSLCFAGTEAERPIIGYEEGVAGFTRDAINGFYKKWYRPRNMRVLAIGDFDSHEMMAEIEKRFGTFVDGPLPERRFPHFDEEKALARKAASDGGPLAVVMKGDYQQPRLEIAFLAPPAEHHDGAALDLAAFALGSGEMSRLNRRLRDGDGVVNSVGASVYAPRFGGVFELSAFTDEDSLLPAITALAREIARLRTTEGVTEGELDRAKASLKADRIFRDETVDGQARSIGYGMRTPFKLQYDEVYDALIASIPGTALEGAVDRWLDPARAHIVLLVAETSPLTEAAVRKAFDDGWKEGSGKAARAAATQSSAAAQRRDREEAVVLRIADGINFVYRQNASTQLFTLTAATEGGLRAEDEKTVGLHYAMAGLLATASGRRDFETMMGLIEGHGAVCEGFSGKDSYGFHVQALPEHAHLMLECFGEFLLDPVFPEEQWESFQREIQQAIATQDDSPSGIAVRAFQRNVYGKHPYRFPLYGTAETVNGYNPDNLLAAYCASRDRGPWCFAGTGPFSPSEAQDRVAKALEGFRPSGTPRKFASETLRGSGESAKLTMVKDREQSHLVYGFPGLDWGDPDRAALDVLVNVLGGHGGRLFMELRDKESLAYSVSPIVAYGRHGGAVGAYMACAPAKAERAAQGIHDEMDKLCKAPPTTEELERAINHIVGTHELSLQRSDSQTSTMALMQLYGYGWDDFLRYPERIAKVAAGDVQRVARRLFTPERAISVLVGPAELV